MPVHIARDFDTDEVVIRIKRGGEADGFARFLETAADGLLHGKIKPTNPNPKAGITIGGAVDSIKSIAAKIHGHNR